MIDAVSESNTDVCPARNRRFAQLLCTALLSAVALGCDSVAPPQTFACGATERGRDTLRVANSPARSLGNRHSRFDRAIF
jgi:hypothetical protein